MDDDPSANATVLPNGHSGMQGGVLPHAHPTVQDHMRMESDPRIDPRALGHGNEGSDVGGGVDPGSLMDRSGRMDARGLYRRRVKDGGGAGVGDIGVLDHEDGGEGRSAGTWSKEGRIAHDQGGGPAGLQLGAVLAVRQEGNRAFASGLERRHPKDLNPGVASYLGAEAPREFVDPQRLGTLKAWGWARRWRWRPPRPNPRLPCPRPRDH